MKPATSLPAGPLAADPTNARPQDPIDIIGDPWGGAEAPAPPPRPGRHNPLNLFRRQLSSHAA